MKSQQPEASQPITGKKAYAAPTLVEYGSVATLTRGSKGSLADGKRRRKQHKGKHGGKGK